jgi:hypothetical protein
MRRIVTLLCISIISLVSAEAFAQDAGTKATAIIYNMPPLDAGGIDPLASACKRTIKVGTNCWWPVGNTTDLPGTENSPVFKAQAPAVDICVNSDVLTNTTVTPAGATIAVYQVLMPLTGAELPVDTAPMADIERSSVMNSGTSLSDAECYTIVDNGEYYLDIVVAPPGGDFAWVLIRGRDR